MSEPITLTGWCIFGLGVIGTFPDGKTKRTTGIMSRVGDVIATKSGSIYKLEPAPTSDQAKHLDDIVKVCNDRN